MRTVVRRLFAALADSGCVTGEGGGTVRRAGIVPYPEPIRGRIVADRNFTGVVVGRYAHAGTP